ncbi:MAG: S41 family peptidase [Bacteroidales bacterium]|jgi:carboxyl-terminal processing protease|nr:S41 family peptidase [Bacteroidales bacterium]
MKNIKRIISIIVLAIILPLNIIAQNENSNQEDKSFELSKNLEIFSAVYRNLYTTYVDEIKPGDLVKTAIDAMLNKLDPYTNYYPESEMEDVKLQLLGQYGGIGALIHQNKDNVVISEPYEDLPAYIAGLKAGDIILEVNGQTAKGKNSDQVREYLRGQAGSTITIKVLRDNQEKTFSFKRKEISLPNVPYSGIVGDNMGYIKLNEYTRDAANNVLYAFNTLKKQNIKGLIVDLRGNGGGLLNEAVDIVNIFVDKGQSVVSTKGKTEDKNQTFKTSHKAIDTNIPIVVLVDGSSASASEITAGSLQDFDRAVIMGQRSFGKGLVQNIIPLIYNSQMKITVSKYYIPSGRCIQAIDYFHRDNKGKAVKVADSLRTAFKTKNGRTVYDGYGIEPDVLIEPEYASNISIAIITKFLAFDYATEFVKKHKTIPPAKDFVITDEIYDDFVAFVKDKDYSYKTESEEDLKDLLEDVKKEKYDSAILNEIKDIQTKLNDDKKNDLYKFKKDIKEILLSEIVVRYYNQKGRIEAMLKLDPEVKQAVELLNNQEKYKNILKIK